MKEVKSKPPLKNERNCAILFFAAGIRFFGRVGCPFHLKRNIGRVPTSVSARRFFVLSENSEPRNGIKHWNLKSLPAGKVVFGRMDGNFAHKTKSPVPRRIKSVQHGFSFPIRVFPSESAFRKKVLRKNLILRKPLQFSWKSVILFPEVPEIRLYKVVLLHFLCRAVVCHYISLPFLFIVA